ncbi:MAG: S-layer homology domain-containing protein [Anaerovoracaceae bacterium]|nr:hypothetical protein [Clostridiales bacterium]
MKKVISIIVAIAMTMTLFAGTAFADPGKGKGHGQYKKFSDMKNHWCKQTAEKMNYWGIIVGYSDGTFKPERVLTQAELAVIIDRLLDLRKNNDDDWDDDWDDDENYSKVPKWAKKAVKKGVHKKYFNLKRFNSHVQVDRLNACVAIAKALELEPVTDFKRNPFKDLRLLNDEDFGYLLALYEKGYIKGYPDGNFNPNKLLSRAHIAAIIEKILEDKEENETGDKTAPDWDKDAYVTATAIRSTSVDLKWSAANDDVEVVGYKVLYELDGNDMAIFVSDRKVTVKGLEENEKYTFTVEAKDEAGNWSKNGPSVTVTTLKEDKEDTIAPTWPNGSILTISQSESGIVTLVWPDAEDNEGIKNYKIYQDGVLIKTVDGDINNVNISGLAEDTKYTFRVRAIDEAGNRSISLVKTYLTN